MRIFIIRMWVYRNNVSKNLTNRRVDPESQRVDTSRRDRLQFCDGLIQEIARVCTWLHTHAATEIDQTRELTEGMICPKKRDCVLRDISIWLSRRKIAVLLHRRGYRNE